MNELPKQQSDQYLECLARGVSHDVNNIFTLVMSMSEIALSEPNVPPNVGMALEKVIKYIQKGWGVTQSVADFGNSFHHSSKRFNLNTFLLRLKGDVFMQISQGQQFKLETNEVNQEIVADDVLLHRALMALCQNALDALAESPKDEKECVLSVDLQPDKGFLEVHVRDNGTGIKEADLEKVLLPFYTTRNRNIHTGMGLTIAQQVARVHGGDVFISSTNKSAGTDIKLYIPLGKVTPSEGQF